MSEERLIKMSDKELKTLTIEESKALLQKWKEQLDLEEKLLNEAKENFNDTRSFVYWLEQLIEKREKSQQKKSVKLTKSQRVELCNEYLREHYYDPGRSTPAGFDIEDGTGQLLYRSQFSKKHHSVGSPFYAWHKAESHLVPLLKEMRNFIQKEIAPTDEFSDFKEFLTNKLADNKLADIVR